MSRVGHQGQSDIIPNQRRVEQVVQQVLDEQDNDAVSLELDGQPAAGTHAGDWPEITHPPSSIDPSELKEGIPRTLIEELAGWHVIGAVGEPGFGTNWYSLYTTNPSLTVPLAFRVDPLAEEVEFCGIMARDGNAATTPFTLPSGFRPPGTVYPACGFYDTSASQRIGFQLEIRATGQIVVAPGVTPASGDLVYLDNVRFPVA